MTEDRERAEFERAKRRFVGQTDDMDDAEAGFDAGWKSGWEAARCEERSRLRSHICHMTVEPALVPEDKDSAHTYQVGFMDALRSVLASLEKED